MFLINSKYHFLAESSVHTLRTAALHPIPQKSDKLLRTQFPGCCNDWKSPPFIKIQMFNGLRTCFQLSGQFFLIGSDEFLNAVSAKKSSKCFLTNLLSPSKILRQNHLIYQLIIFIGYLWKSCFLLIKLLKLSLSAVFTVIFSTSLMMNLTFLNILNGSVLISANYGMLNDSMLSCFIF